ncbi:MAG TPA: TadE/TadG family type IV pilus assembly protein [Methylocystis sp.]|nr:TadE/TadG family type IV pilus assembly protein [Methylocystis sp.]
MPTLAPQQFLRDRRATALVEFAWLFPIMMLALFGAYNVSRAANATRELSELSDDIAQMLAETQQSGSPYCTATSPTTCGALFDYTLKYAYDSAMVEFPEILANSNGVASSTIKTPASGGALTVSMTGVVFAYNSANAGCTAPALHACYTGYVVWTAGAATRPCGQTYGSGYPNSSPPVTTQLPDALFTPVTNPPGAASATSPPLFAVVVDVAYTWKPTLFTGPWFSLIPSITIARSSYLNPRYVSQLTYYSQGNGYGTACGTPSGWSSLPGSPVWP